jgi:hypothetical protein
VKWIKNTGYDKKIVVSGKVVEVYEYERMVLTGKEPPGGSRKPVEERTERTKEVALQRAQKTLRRLVNSNTDILERFITLTFEQEITDLVQADKLFDLFRRRVERHLKRKLRYIAVPEIQHKREQKTGKAVWHYHLISDMPYTPVNELRQLWGHGFVRINKIDNVDNVGAYLSKYMSKELSNTYPDKKAYRCSSGLKRPREYTTKKNVQTLEKELDIERTTPKFKTTFASEHLGEITYTQYIITSDACQIAYMADVTRAATA